MTWHSIAPQATGVKHFCKNPPQFLPFLTQKLNVWSSQTWSTSDQNRVICDGSRVSEVEKEKLPLYDTLGKLDSATSHCLMGELPLPTSGKALVQGGKGPISHQHQHPLSPFHLLLIQHGKPQWVGSLQKNLLCQRIAMAMARWVRKRYIQFFPSERSSWKVFGYGCNMSEHATMQSGGQKKEHNWW